jgi:subtilase family serine protease
LSRKYRSALALIGAAALSAGAVTAASAATTSKSLPGSVPSWANAAHKAGASSGSTRATFRVYLTNRDEAGAQAYALAVSTKGNPLYGHFLSPSAFTARFSPTQASWDGVASWLKGQGFTISDAPGNRKYVEATGTLAQAATAFGTSFSEYRVEGRTVRSNSSPLKVPGSLGQVQGVVGLDESQTLAHADLKLPAPAGFRNAQPCSAYWGQKTVANTPTPDGTPLPATPSAFAPCGYSGAQLQGAYGMSGIIDTYGGKGVTIGIIDAYASSTIEQDANTYFSRHGLPTFAPGQFSQIVSPGTYNRATNNRQDPTGWAGEETLDIEAAHTMAPKANITYIGAPNNFRDMDAIMNRVVTNHWADIVSNSYGYGGEALPMGTIKPSLDTQVQAAAEGISLFFSSGDSGDETGGLAANAASATPDWPASSPFVTAVGGTSLGVSAGNARVFELGWETARSSLDKTTTTWNAPTFQYGSGGGTSRLFAQPSYQAGVVPDALALGSTSGGRSQRMRVVPDVAAIGDPTTGMLVGETQQFSDGSVKYDEYRIGGTSLSSPIYAGIFANVVQKAGHAYGLANPALYAAQTTSYDVTKADLGTYPGAVRADYVNGEDAASGYSYTARWFDRDDLLTIHVRPGYDDVTGVGAPTGQAWFDAVAGYTG